MSILKEYRRFGAAEPDDREFWTETGVLVGNGRFGLETQVGAGTEGGVIEVTGAERNVLAVRRSTARTFRGAKGTEITPTEVKALTCGGRPNRPLETETPVGVQNYRSSGGAEPNRR